jgi:hypothetical protein
MAEVAVPGLDPDDRDDERNDGDVPGLEGVGAARPRDAG